MVLVLTSAARPQEVFTVIRFITAREGGPVPVGEVTAFAADEPKAVAWARITGVVVSHSVSFRWRDAQQRIYRVSPTRIITAGEEFVFDEMPIRGTPAAALTGAWTVDFVVDNRTVATLRFSILPPRAVPRVDSIKHQSTLTTRGQQTQTAGTYTSTVVNSLDHQVEWTGQYADGRAVSATLTAGRLWGSQDGVRGSGVFSYASDRGVFVQGGAEVASAFHSALVPPHRMTTGAVFIDLRYAAPRLPTFAFSARRATGADDLMPSLSDAVTTTWSASSSYFSSRYSLIGTYTAQDVDDRTSLNADSSTRTLALTGLYFATPQLFVFVTRTNIDQDFVGTSLAAAFTQRQHTTTVRVNYQPWPNLTLVAFFQDSGLDRSDGVLRASTTQRGVEAAYRLGPVFTVRALAQWQNQDSTTFGVTTRSEQHLQRFAVDAILNGGLTAGLAYSPQTTTTAATALVSDLWTVYVNYFPNAAFFASVTYTFNAFSFPGFGTDTGAFALSMRYAPNDTIEYQLTAQTTDLRAPVMPLINTSTLNYQFSAIVKF